MNEEELIKRKIIDTANQAYKTNSFAFTNFLSLAELSIYHSLSKELNFIESKCFGGYESSERNIIRFGSKENLGYSLDFPIKLIKISPLTPKFSEKLNHRDYLGALMNLGIKRELLGDIVIKDLDAYLFCLDHISDFIIDNLDKVRHTNVKLEIIEDANLEGIGSKKEALELIAASARLDAVVSSITKLSRSKVKDLFLSKKIYVNGLLNENVSYKLKDKDVLVIRGIGKFNFLGNGKETKSGRVYVHLEKYI